MADKTIGDALEELTRGLDAAEERRLLGCLDLRAAVLVRGGMSPADAVRRALTEAGASSVSSGPTPVDAPAQTIGGSER